MPFTKISLSLSNLRQTHQISLLSACWLSYSVIQPHHQQTKKAANSLGPLPKKAITLFLWYSELTTLSDVEFFELYRHVASKFGGGGGGGADLSKKYKKGVA